VMPQKVKYTKVEDEALLEYVSQKSCTVGQKALSYKANKVYKQAETDGLLPNRTWQSMREHFNKWLEKDFLRMQKARQAGKPSSIFTRDASRSSMVETIEDDDDGDEGAVAPGVQVQSPAQKRKRALGEEELGEESEGESDGESSGSEYNKEVAEDDDPNSRETLFEDVPEGEADRIYAEIKDIATKTGCLPMQVIYGGILTSGNMAEAEKYLSGQPFDEASAWTFQDDELFTSLSKAKHEAALLKHAEAEAAGKTYKSEWPQLDATVRLRGAQATLDRFRWMHMPRTGPKKPCR